jgi:hypothetical protein
MTRKLYSPVLVAVASAALIAGCGGSSSPKTNSSKTTSSKTTPSTKTSTTNTTPSISSLTPGELRTAVKGCQRAAASFPSQFGSQAKSDLSQVCSDLQSGNLSAAESDAEKYCTDIIASLPAKYKSAAQAGCNEIKKEF